MKIKNCYQTPPKQTAREFPQKKVTFTKDSPTVYEIPARPRSGYEYPRSPLPDRSLYGEGYYYESDEEYSAALKAYRRDRDGAKLPEEEDMDEEEEGYRSFDVDVGVDPQKTNSKTKSL